MEPISMDDIVPTIERIKETFVKQNEKFAKMREELEEKEKMLSEREEKLNQAQLAQQQLTFEYMNLENEFKKISELFNEMSDKQETSLDVKQLLGIYIALLEKVFAGQPHAKILYILHGDKPTMTREELTKATGFSPAIVLHSLHELNRAELVQYDVEEGKAELVNRIF